MNHNLFKHPLLLILKERGRDAKGLILDMKALPPTLREKKRYIVFEVMGKKMPFVAVQQMMDKTLHTFLGDLGMAHAGVIHMADQYNYQQQKGIMRVNHKHVDHVKAAFTFTDTPVRSIGTSGVLKKSQTYIGGN